MARSRSCPAAVVFLGRCRRLLRELSKGERILVVLRWGRGLSLEEISEVLPDAGGAAAIAIDLEGIERKALRVAPPLGGAGR